MLRDEITNEGYIFNTDGAASIPPGLLLLSFMVELDRLPTLTAVRA